MVARRVAPLPVLLDRPALDRAARVDPPRADRRARLEIVDHDRPVKIEAIDLSVATETAVIVEIAATDRPALH